MIEEQFEFSIPQYKLLTNTIQFSFKIGKRAHLGQVIIIIITIISSEKHKHLISFFLFFFRMLGYL